MKGRWIISGNHLALQSGENTYHPTAAEIYSLIDKGGVVNGIECTSPAASLPKIRFSKKGSPVSIHLTSDEDGTILVYVCTLRKGKYLLVDVINGMVVDQCVYDSTWFYLSVETGLVQDVLSHSGIMSNGAITLKQYLKIFEHSLYNDSNVLNNHINPSTFHKPVIGNEEIPDSLKATLFPYQKNGYLWMRTMLDINNGCILGDEMGLGKTMQVITEMLFLKSRNATPMLVVAPISLLTNWQKECEKFAPSLITHIHHGYDRISNYREFSRFDVVITAYSTVVSDIHMLNMIEWQLVTLDEAQNIKNPYSARTKNCKAIHRVRSLAVSGTPFENHITDIWSILDYIQPGILGTVHAFQNSISDDIEGGEKIEPILSALMVRRLVSEVARDLPEKIVTTQPLQMSEAESEMYCQYLSELKNTYNVDAITLGMLQKLRIFCSHPYAAADSGCNVDYAEASIKYQRFCELIEEIISMKEKVIVFTSYKRMFDIFEADIPQRFGIKLWGINGETPVLKRQEIVDNFNQLDGSAMLILNPTAAGTGLNITGANHVIHYNLEWNPSLEDQSTARAFRRGQQKTVFVYRLYYENTVEQVVNERTERKRGISSSAVIGNDGKSQERADIIRAIELIPEIKNQNIDKIYEYRPN